MDSGDSRRTQEKQIKILVIAETNILVGYILEQGVDFDYLRDSAEQELIHLPRKFIRHKGVGWVEARNPISPTDPVGSVGSFSPTPRRGSLILD